MGRCGTPKKYKDLLDPKSRLFGPHPLNPPIKTPFLVHFVAAESGPFGRFFFGVPHTPPGYGPGCGLGLVGYANKNFVSFLSD